MLVFCCRFSTMHFTASGEFVRVPFFLLRGALELIVPATFLSSPSLPATALVVVKTQFQYSNPMRWGKDVGKVLRSIDLAQHYTGSSSG